MTIKKQHALDLAWRCLAETVSAHGRWVSAGELAKAMGVCRNTAHRWLQELIATETIMFREDWHGKVCVTTYRHSGE